MKKVFSGMMILVAGLLMASPVFAHCGHCDTDKAHDTTASTEKQCASDCDKPCCAEKKDKKHCAGDDKKDCAHKKEGCDKKSHSHGTQNFGPKKHS